MRLSISTHSRSPAVVIMSTASFLMLYTAYTQAKLPSATSFLEEPSPSHTLARKKSRRNHIAVPRLGTDLHGWGSAMGPFSAEHLHINHSRRGGRQWGFHAASHWPNGAIACWPPCRSSLAVAHVWFWIWCCTRNLVINRSLRTSIGQGCGIKLGDEDTCLPPSSDVTQSWYRASLPLKGHNRWDSRRV
ncbi:uncharacterized protein K489DRAFT_159491 [Dissoconium aciculare CBS 342.82]|uniref:Uncharacterized protein n=1 Tax=Dissoconium aciculare CBS 342.82 TaxID=1314786 RepID=A0A6J3MC96_9PEZI|nr:uncharacterized protein K489DRAFT_159491 [Dissoconium aciculare CBS 342.82]KAF1825503.1 hypothetical protein K489DRAFT_159491 [Dissoconium aciculare CBS 342.82]